jgi:hypothetical protein
VIKKIKGSVLLHTLNGVLHTKRRRAKNDLTLHTVCKIFKEKKLKIGKISFLICVQNTIFGTLHTVFYL